MKGWLRGMMAVGLLSGGLLGVGCADPDKGPMDTSKSPIQTRYQTPAAEESEPATDERYVHPSTEGVEAGGAGITPGSRERMNPHRMPGRADLGSGLADSYKAMPAQGGTGGAGQGGTDQQVRDGAMKQGAGVPQLNPGESAGPSQGAMNQNNTPRGE